MPGAVAGPIGVKARGTRKPQLSLSETHRAGEGPRPSRGLQGDGSVAVLITFSGLDGPARTTLIAELTQELTLRGRSVTRFTNDEDVGFYSAIRRFRRERGWLPRDGLAPRCDTVKSPPIRLALQTARGFLHGRLVSALLLPLDLSLFMLRRCVFDQRCAHPRSLLLRFTHRAAVGVHVVGKGVPAASSGSRYFGVRGHRPGGGVREKGRARDPGALATRTRIYQRLFSRLPHGVTIGTSRWTPRSGSCSPLSSNAGAIRRGRRRRRTRDSDAARIRIRRGQRHRHGYRAGQFRFLARVAWRKHLPPTTVASARRLQRAPRRLKRGVRRERGVSLVFLTSACSACSALKSSPRPLSCSGGKTVR